MRVLSCIPILFVVACAQTQAADVAIRGVTVVNMADGSLSSDQTVLIKSNRISPEQKLGVMSHNGP